MTRLRHYPDSAPAIQRRKAAAVTGTARSRLAPGRLAAAPLFAGMGDDPGAPAAALDVTRHARYFRYCLSGLQEDYAPLDTSRMTAVRRQSPQRRQTQPQALTAPVYPNHSQVYFCVSALDFLGALDSSVRERVAAWVLGHQFRPSPTAKGRDAERAGGFRGGPFLGHPFGARGEVRCSCAVGLAACRRVDRTDRPVRAAAQTSDLDAPHIAMSYTALAVLNTVGDDLSRVDRAGVLASVAALARPDGRSAPLILPNALHRVTLFPFQLLLQPAGRRDGRAVRLLRVRGQPHAGQLAGGRRCGDHPIRGALPGATLPAAVQQ